MTAGASLPDGRTPVLFSAHAADLVEQDAAAIAAYLDRRPHVTDVGSVAATVMRTRRMRRHRAVVRAADRGELTAALQALAAGADHPLVTRAASGPRAQSGRIAFVFPGQGSQWPSMGVEAYERLPEYRAEVDDCAAEFSARGLASPLDYLLADAGAAVDSPDRDAPARRTTNDFTQVQIQGAQFVHGVALARVWRACGVLPDITIGHSLGEIGAAYVAGAITREAAVAVVAARATLLDTLTGPYRVAVLGVTPDEALEVVAATAGWVELSVVNSPTSVAISGETDAVAAAVREVAARGVFAREIEMWFPAHTTALDPLRADLEALLPSGEFAETPVQFIGSATAGVVAAGTGFADYWYRNLRSTVRFDRAVATALECGATTFVEMSAHPALLYAMGDVLDARPDLAPGRTVLVGSGRRDEPLTDRLASNVMTVALADTAYRWADVVPEAGTTLRDFPFAPMRAEHHWARAEPLPPVTGLTVGTEHWTPVTVTRTHAERAVAVVALDGDTPLAAGLSVILGDTPGVDVVAPESADLLVVMAPNLDDEDPAGSARGLADAVNAGLLRYADSITATTRDVWLVTVRAEAVAGDADGGVLPGQAALAAMHRSVGLEHPEHNFRHLDLPTGEPDRVVADAIVDVILSGAEDLALRVGDTGPTAHRRTLRDEQALPPAWHANTFDNVLITGGSGAVGLHFARALAARGAHRIVLLSRRGVPPEVLAELAASGEDVEILAPRCDITDPHRIAATAREFGGAGATLVVHAAGAATIAPAGELTGDAVLASAAAKVAGLDAVLAAWPLQADARLLLCSSVSGVWGGSGHAAYAAANRLLDVTAARKRSAGRRATSVRWGLWPGAGVIGADEVARVERSGLTAMDADRAVDAALRDHAADPLVFSAAADRLRLFLGAAYGSEPPEVPAASGAAAAPEGDGGSADAAVHAALGAVLKLADTTALDFDAALLDLGVDSLLAIDLRKKLKRATGHNVPLATILGGVTANELIERLDDPGNRAPIRD